MLLENKDAYFKQLDEKNSRKVLVHSEGLMLAEISFDKGGIGALHKHADHEQAGYVVSGSFEVTVGNETKILKKGDSYFAPKNVMHGVVALEEDSVLLDAFTPMRKDFLD